MERQQYIDFAFVKEHADFERVLGYYNLKVTGRGKQLSVVCPFHDDTQPSLKVTPQTRGFHCFGCGAKGNILDFVRHMEQCDLREAAEILANICRIDRPPCGDKADCKGDACASFRANSGGISMSLHINARVPVDDTYAALLGKAVYVFAYYEWTIIWIMERLQSGFLREYCRCRKMTSGNVCSKFKKMLDDRDRPINFSKVSREELEGCIKTFKCLIKKRNALIHAHPCTDTDGSTQILALQTILKDPIPDMKWPREEVEAIILKFDQAACDMSALLDKLR